MRVIQLIDSLHPGGAERMAVSLANGLTQTIEASYLCTTREEGMLKDVLLDQVQYLFLNKKSTLDIGAYLRLLRYIKKHRIQVIHAHSSSFFLATLIKIRLPKVILVWHDHFGKSETVETRSFAMLKWCSRFFNSSIAVNEILQQWAVANLHCKKVSFVKNFVIDEPVVKRAKPLEGKEGKRLVCLANFRPQKDHETLLHAFWQVQQTHPDASLHLIGKPFKSDYTRRIREMISDNKTNNVYIHGEQLYPMGLLRQCDIGVLSSVSEGLPVALLEYGLANLPVVCTQVGQCESVLNGLGLLVPPHDPKALASAIVQLMEDNDLCRSMGSQYRQHIIKEYSFQNIADELIAIYHDH